jgi:L-proline 4-hydroxylase
MSTETTAYHREGWCRTGFRLAASEVALLRERVDGISAQTRPEVVYERDGETVRAIHGCHRYDEVCARLVRLPSLVDLAEALLGEPVYVYQFKVNLKHPGVGHAWPWHQDYTFWREEDGMPTANAVSIMVLLDDVDESNGPLVVVPGSHRSGLFDVPSRAAGSGGDWRENVSADLTYTVSDRRAGRLSGQYGTRAIVGPAGSVYAFHPVLVHSSSDNLSTRRRAILLVTYNAVSNAPDRPTRPVFLVDTDTTAVTRLATDRLGYVP